MKHLRSLGLAALVSVSGCGQKGPLVLPDAHTAAPVVSPPSAPVPPPNGSDADGPAAGPAAMPAPADTTPKDKKKPEVTS